MERSTPRLANALANRGAKVVGLTLALSLAASTLVTTASASSRALTRPPTTLSGPELGTVGERYKLVVKSGTTLAGNRVTLKRWRQGEPGS